MEAYTYSNIFETKGIEYIIVITFLLVLIPFWLFVSKKHKTVQFIRQGIRVLTANLLRIPEGLFFSRNHTWLYLEKSGQAKVGIDDFLQNVLGEISVLPVKTTGDTVKKGELLAFVEQGGKQLHIKSPLSGQVASINTMLIENNGELSGDDVEDDWLYSIVPRNWQAETAGFLLGAEAKGWFSDEITRLKDFLGRSLATSSGGAQPAVVFQEGGELQPNPLADLDASVWDEFEKEFLN
ncbi:glycine cleavage system protein H [Draconibacterium halophilum]|uniref:Glycine cleavage system protein H n=1 Tax=Draconibacterium halophilum TaxID=2706887 RepID=A0A6C0RAS9_9BACT|nr:glycine cleavage system protein H [Draconibacterium halophilum]QIA07504.1 glycine cleavage system protein H [Draconibacterium halophilum]